MTDNNNNLKQNQIKSKYDLNESDNCFEFNKFWEELSEIDISDQNVWKTSVEVETNEDETHSDQDLHKWFLELDQRNGKTLVKYGVQVQWSNRLTKNFGSVIAAKDEKPIRINISRKLLERSPQKEIQEILLKYMKDAFQLISTPEKANKAIITTKSSEEKVNKTEKNESLREDDKEKEEKENKKSLFEIMKTYAEEMDSKGMEAKKLKEIEDNINSIEEKNIVDERLQQLDPNPDIQKLFKEYDNRYFMGVLKKQKVELSWSDQLTTTAGVTCEAQPDKPIKIRLSRKLLEFGPRRQLVETLLHEMIHAFMFVFGLEPDRSHGDQYMELMESLNAMTGANITVYHDIDRYVAQRDFYEKSYLDWIKRDREIEREKQLIKSHHKNLNKY